MYIRKGGKRLKGRQQVTYFNKKRTDEITFLLHSLQFIYQNRIPFLWGRITILSAFSFIARPFSMLTISLFIVNISISIYSPDNIPQFPFEYLIIQQILFTITKNISSLLAKNYALTNSLQTFLNKYGLGIRIIIISNFN